MFRLGLYSPIGPASTDYSSQQKSASHRHYGGTGASGFTHINPLADSYTGTFILDGYYYTNFVIIVKSIILDIRYT
jgi:hypothetical protein